jgi:hypothetical protein
VNKISGKLSASVESKHSAFDPLKKRIHIHGLGAHALRLSLLLTLPSKVFEFLVLLLHQKRLEYLQGVSLASKIGPGFGGLNF